MGGSGSSSEGRIREACDRQNQRFVSACQSLLHKVPRETPGQTVSAQYCREGLPSSVRELSLGAQRGTRRRSHIQNNKEHSQKLLPVWKQELATLESGGWVCGGVKVCVAGLEAGVREGNSK